MDPDFPSASGGRAKAPDRAPKATPSARERASESVLAPYFSRTRGDIRPGAHRIRALLAACGFPTLSPKTRILVAGTNGKGTTCSLLESALRACGMRTGLYTSPHLVHPGERIRVAGVPSTEAQLEPVVARVDAAARTALPDATFFELLTATAFLRFEEEHTEVDVIEVGLGGRYDSTNVVAPTVSVLVSVGLDHTEMLGPDEACIAFDKAHVSRRGRPLVCGPLSANARLGLGEAVARTGARVVDASESGPLSPFALQVTSLLGGGGLDPNRRVALVALATLAREGSDPCGGATLPLSECGIARGFAAAFWPGRFDVRRVRGRTIVFDAAHNAHGARYFVNTFLASPLAGTRPVFVYGSLSDKDWPEVLSTLAPVAGAFVFTEPSSPRAVPASEIAARTSGLAAFRQEHGAEAPRVVACEADLARALDVAFHKAGEDNVACVVIGSIALLGDAMERLEVDPFDAGR